MLMPDNDFELGLDSAPTLSGSRSREHAHAILQIMKSPNSANFPGLEDKTFLILVVVVSLAFAWILWPFFGAILWGTILAILFAPLYRRLVDFLKQRRTVAALATVTIVLLIVILPLTLIGGLLVQEGLGVYEKFQAGDLNPGRYFQQVLGVLPAWVNNLIDRFGLTNFGAIQEKLSTGMVQGGQFVAAKALNIGQNTFDFIVNLAIVLYLLFFLLRDGDDLAATHQDRNSFARASTARALQQLHHRYSRYRQRQCRGGDRARSARRTDLLVFGRPRGGVMGGGHGFSIAAAGGWERPGVAAGCDLFFSDRRDVARHRSDRLWRARHRPGG